MILKELFDTSASYDFKPTYKKGVVNKMKRLFIKEVPNGYAVEFKINNKPYTMQFKKAKYTKDAYEMAFWLNTNSLQDKWGVSGKGDSIAVFSTVISIFQRFINEYDPEEIYFTAREPSRDKLYTKLIKLLDRKVKGYHGIRIGDIGNNLIGFMIKKDDGSEK